MVQWYSIVYHSFFVCKGNLFRLIVTYSSCLRRRRDEDADEGCNCLPFKTNMITVEDDRSSKDLCDAFRNSGNIPVVSYEMNCF